MPYAAPGSLTVAEPISSLPDWLLPDYVSHCEPALTRNGSTRRPAATRR